MGRLEGTVVAVTRLAAGSGIRNFFLVNHSLKPPTYCTDYGIFFGESEDCYCEQSFGLQLCTNVT